MRASVETEVKLTAGDGFVMPTVGVTLPPRLLVSTYHDTPDLRLAQHGITLRHRIAAGTGHWQLKIPHGASRIELEVPGAPAHPPGDLVALLPVLTRGQALEPVARLRTRREVQRGAGVEVHDDAVSVLDGVRVRLRFHEIEVEVLGDEGDPGPVARRLLDAGAVPAVSTAKLYRALDLPGPVGPFVAAPGAAPLDVLAIAIREQARLLVVHDPGTRLGTDPEDLHQLRVASRRTRAYLRAARSLVDRGWAAALVEELRWLGSTLGPLRDLDVMIEHLGEEVAALGDDAAAAQPLLHALEAERGAARTAVFGALSSDRYYTLIARLEGVDAAPIPTGSRSDSTLRSVAAKELLRARRAASSIGDDAADDELHALRIRVKRVRYALELAAHELGEDGGRAVTAAKRLQNVLGDHQDAVVAEARLRQLAALHPVGPIAAGRVVERERQRRAAARAGWRAAWRRFERRASAALS